MAAFILVGVFATLLSSILYIPALFNLAFNRWYRSKGADVREKYRAVDVRRSAKDTMRDAFREQLKNAWTVLLVGLGLGLVVFFTRGGGEVVESVKRPAFGEGESSVSLMANLEGEEESEEVSFSVGEKNPSEDEVDSFFATACEAALVEVLGDNESFENVTQDLDLITGTDQGIEITWQVSDPDVISTLGVLGSDIPMEGADVTLTMTMTYGDFLRSFEISVTVRQEETAQDEDTLSAYISDEIAKAVDEENVTLPTEYEGSELVLYEEENTIGQNLTLLAALAAVVLWLGSESKLEERLSKRKKGLEEDYPDIVSRFAILFSAGLTVPAAWKRLAEDYERELEKKAGRACPSKMAFGQEQAYVPRQARDNMRYGYEELRLTALELNNAGYSDRIFYDFGKRCGNYRYMKLADVLDQSMKKGTVQLSTYMEEEAISAFELRKLQAAKTGEEAGTKLLLPMMMMFGLVIAMVVVPAWSGMSF